LVHIVETCDLRFGYRNGPDILTGLDLQVGEGEIFGLLGPSGSGKSTLQSILLGFQPGYQGSATVFGAPARRPRRSFYRRVGVSFELPAAYLQLTARENLELFAALQGGAIRPVMDVLADLDLAENAEKKVAAFSKGMKMRLNLARALLHDPELYLFDEPTSGQDPARARLTRALILQLKARGKTVLLTTHDMSAAEQVCDRVGFLLNGRMAIADRPAALKRAYGEARLDVVHGGDHGEMRESFPLQGLAGNARFQAILAEDQILSVHSAESSLDDVFVRLAGAGRS
jgi:fluoroquinolone transport system ATP-binding protein